ncbi:hypothetical protein G7046_g3141 [Stylonectria norvegica]|nr:hypothetical protein G7046_g3141 [Stylonectria norvegica]
MKAFTICQLLALAGGVASFNRLPETPQDVAVLAKRKDKFKDWTTHTVEPRLTCYPAGQAWATIAEGKDAATRACEHLDGPYHVNQMKTQCFDGNQTHYWFEITRRHTTIGELSMSTKKCIDYMHDVVDTCRLGGQNSTSEWHFRADIEVGADEPRGCARLPTYVPGRRGDQ